MEIIAIFGDVFLWSVKHPFWALLLLGVAYVVLFKLYYSKAKFLSYPAAIPFIVFDAMVNIGAVSIIFLELPQEWLVTDRLQRWKRMSPTGWRQNIRHHFAMNMCKWMNKLDPDHC